MKADFSPLVKDMSIYTFWMKLGLYCFLFSNVSSGSYPIIFIYVFPGGSDSKASAYNARALGSIPGSGRSPGEGTSNSSTLAWKIPWMEEPGGLQSMGSQRVRHNWATLLSLSFLLYIKPSSFLLGITTAKYGYERHVLNVYVLKTKLKWLWITCFKCLCSISLIIELFVGRKWLGVEVGEGDWRRKKSYRRVIPERK